jgi:hypothetical protein
MTKLTQIIPEYADANVDGVVALACRAAQHSLPVASPEAKDYCTKLSELLLKDSRARDYPELQALGFWLRPASVTTMVQNYLVHTPRLASGVVFQLLPSNVATLFGYTSAISLLCGNVTVIRLSSAENVVQNLLVEFMQEALQQSDNKFCERLIIIRYPHDDAITEKISFISNARLVWGSDETVDHIGGIILPSAAQHISFGDRFSAMAIKAEEYLALDEDSRAALIKNAFNDIYVFDQRACASPRLAIWVGNKDSVQKASDDFYMRLVAYAEERHYRPDIGGSLVKLNTCYLALHDLLPESYKIYAPTLNVITLSDFKKLSEFKPVNYGYGTMLAARLERLSDLAPHTEKRDQTLSISGFDAAEIQAFHAHKNRQGFDRMVNIGQALTFDPVWDGRNLFDAMTRSVKDSV